MILLCNEKQVAFISCTMYPCMHVSIPIQFVTVFNTYIFLAQKSLKRIKNMNCPILFTIHSRITNQIHMNKSLTDDGVWYVNTSISLLSSGVNIHYCPGLEGQVHIVFKENANVSKQVAVGWTKQLHQTSIL